MIQRKFRFFCEYLAGSGFLKRPIAFLIHRPVPRGWRWTIALIAAGLVAVFAFGHLFTTFMPWDDEGYFLIAYRDFLSGRILYDQVFAPYGPLTFYSAGLLAGFDPANVTNDAFRWITLPAWIAIAALLASVVWRWTGRFTVSLSVFLLAGLNLQGLAASVGHPQLWVIMASAILVWLGCDWASQSGKEWRAFLTGSVAAAILLFKINIGIFSLIAISLMLSLHLPGWARSVLSGLLILAASALGIMLYFSTPSMSEKYFALAYLVSLGAIVMAVINLSADREIRRACLPWLAAGFAVSACAVLGVTLGFGTTPRALFDNLVLAPLHLAKTYHAPFWTQKASLVISIMGFGIAMIAIQPRRLLIERSVWLAALKIGAGASLLFESWLDNRQALTGSLLFLWLLVLDAPMMSGSAYFNRLLLALLSALLSLQLYPMAGEQADWAALLLMTAMAVLLADGMNLLVRVTQIGRLPRLSNFAGRAVGIFLASILVFSMGGNALRNFRQWQREQPVNLPGARWLHLPTADVDQLTTIVSQLVRNCQNVMMMPGLYSFSLWSGVPPFEGKRFNSWVFLWPEDVEEHEMRDIRENSHSCILVSGNIYKFFRKLTISKGNDKLLTEIQQTMNPIAAVKDITIYRPN
jgi:hypothetical protein